MITLENYREIVGDTVISEIYKKARRLYGKHVVHINSTYAGGGVAEMLDSLVPLMNDVGLEVGWRILHGNPDFFITTKKFHNALQGEDINFTEMKQHVYTKANEDFSVFTHIDHDCVIIHDPQPLSLIKYYKKRQPWVWRCHVDLSNPNQEVWNYLKNFILRYDLVIVSNKKYTKDDLPVEQKIVHPTIDPLSSKNKELDDETIEKYITKFDIPTDKPLITQVSRFDKWKNPEGAIDVLRRVWDKIDCRLVLCGSMAADDPEGYQIYENVKQKAEDLVENRDVILITSENNILVNALQRRSDVVLQTSIKEGFGLSVTEALWKETPVVASNVGGIPLQVIDGETGFLVDPHDTGSFAEKVIRLLQEPDLAEKMGKKGKEHIRRNFLITRLLSDYLSVLNDIIH
ncbi:glycosyltransferase [Candidatus Borrarchaeum sp.]|uniref:glycosyltransferase n=1 Tax=Candidatus Borrarchaeum sp. TaxID=2846742 RepID=UPI00257BBEF0|nr:glycosyltransferase [Candidatus Borrarchaeum sp.]